MCSPCSPQPEAVLSALLEQPDGLSDRGVERLIVGVSHEIRRAVRLLQATGRIVSAPRPGGGWAWTIGGEQEADEPAMDERVLETLGEHPKGLSLSRLEDLIGGRRSFIGAALRRLRATGQTSARRSPGRRGWLVWTLGSDPVTTGTEEQEAREEKARLAVEGRTLTVLGKHPAGLSGRQVEALVGGPTRVLRATLKSLYAAGRVTAALKAGRGGGTLWKIA